MDLLPRTLVMFNARETPEVRAWAEHPEMQRLRDPDARRALAKRLDALCDETEADLLERFNQENRQGMTRTERWANMLVGAPILRLAVWVGDWMEDQRRLP